MVKAYKYRLMWLDVNMGGYRFRHFDDPVLMESYYKMLSRSIYVKDLRIFSYSKSVGRYVLTCE